MIEPLFKSVRRWNVRPDRAAATAPALLHLAERMLEDLERQMEALRGAFAREYEHHYGDAKVDMTPHVVPDDDGRRLRYATAATLATVVSCGFAALLGKDLLDLPSTAGALAFGLLNLTAVAVCSVTLNFWSTDSRGRAGMLVRLATVVAVAFVVFFALPNTFRSTLLTIVGIPSLTFLAGALWSMSTTANWSRRIANRYISLQAQAYSIRAMMIDVVAAEEEVRKTASRSRTPKPSQIDSNENERSVSSGGENRISPRLLSATRDLATSKAAIDTLRVYALILSTAAVFGAVIIYGALNIVSPIVLGMSVGGEIIVIFFATRAIVLWRQDIAELNALETGLSLFDTEPQPDLLIPIRAPERNLSADLSA